ncbi:MAG: HU family DNA-binding protein [Rhodothermales bacterium]
MSDALSEQLNEALGHVIREALIRREQVDIPGLGTFRVDRRSSEMIEGADGELVMRPPRDEVIFIPDFQ